MNNHKYNVLIINKDEEFRKELTHFLLKENPDFEIDTACAMEDGLNKIINNKYHFLVTEHHVKLVEFIIKTEGIRFMGVIVTSYDPFYDNFSMVLECIESAIIEDSLSGEDWINW